MPQKDCLVEVLLLSNYILAKVIAFLTCDLHLGRAFGRIKWWKALAIGGGFSLLIEVLQFAFKRGFSEFDDVFHNVLGCAIGFALYLLIERLVRRDSTVRSMPKPNRHSAPSDDVFQR